MTMPITNRPIRPARSMRTPLALLALCGLPAAASAQQVFPTWIGPANGAWSVAGNWMPVGVPNNAGGMTFAPIIPGGGSPILNISVAIDKFGIGPGASIQLNNNLSLSVRGQTDGLGVTGLLSNEGTLVINSAGNLTDLIITGGAGAYAVHGNLAGTPARIQMSNTTANRIYGASGNEKIVFGAQTVLEGAGQIGINLIEIENFGQLRAVGSSGLFIDPNGAGMTNHALLVAAAGPLTLTSGTFRNVGTGAIILAEDNQSVGLSSARIEGGTLATNGSGVISLASSTLASVNLTGTLVLPNNNVSRIESLLRFSGPSGVLAIQSAGNLTDLIISSPVATLDGFNGTAGVTMSNTSANRIYSDPGDRRLVLADTAFIRGAGQVGINLMSLTVEPTCMVDAVGSTGLTIDPNGDGVLNRGVLRASGGATLVLANGFFDNTVGEVRAENGGVVVLASATVLGGVFTTFGSGSVIATGSVMESVTNNGVVNLNNNTSTSLRAGFANNSTFSMNSAGNLTDLTILGNTSISGSGVLSMSNTTANRIYDASGVARLTNAAGHTIRGSGQIGINLMALTNNGLIEAVGSTGLSLDPNGGGVDNNAILRARSGSTLVLASGDFDNVTGIVDVENGGTCVLSSAVVVGGLFTSAGTGSIFATGSVMDGVTNGATINLSNNTNTSLRASFINNSTFNMNSAGNATDLFIVGNTSISGSGVLNMSNTTANRIYDPNGVDRLTNAAGHTIRGSGQIGVGLMALTNNGLIEALGSTGLTITPNGGGVDNNAILRARTGSTLVLAGGSVDNADGIVNVQDGANCVLSGTTVIGGLFTSDGTGAFLAASSIVQGVTSTATVNIANNSSTSLRGSFINNRTLNMNSGGNLTDLFIIGNTSISGSGVLNMSNTLANRIYAPSGADRLTNTGGHTIRGSGQIGIGLMALTNRGLIDASSSSGMLIDTNGGGFDNQGLLRVSGGNLTVGSGPFTTSGTVVVDSGRLLNRSTGAWVQTDGIVIADGELQVVTDIYQLQGGVLGGTGRVDSNVTNSGGTVSPGMSPGTLTIEGNFVQQSGGTLAVEITGVTSGSQNDLLTILGTGSLNGTISIRRPTGFVPVIGQGFTILTTTGTNTLTGTFSSISSPDQWHVVYLNNAAMIVFDGVGSPTCQPDFNGDGILDPDDLADFIGCFFSQPPCPAADYSGDGSIDPDDLADYITAFFAGC